MNPQVQTRPPSPPPIWSSMLPPAIVDPVLDFDSKGGELSTASADAVLAAVTAQGLTLAYVLETHAHADHLSAGDQTRQLTGAKLLIGSRITDVQYVFAPVFDADDVACDGSQFDILLNDGDSLPSGTLTIRALHTPGHTPACLTYLVGDAAFVGDTLFMPDYGTARADFPPPGGGTRGHFIARSKKFSRCLPKRASLSGMTIYRPGEPTIAGRRPSARKPAVTSMCAPKQRRTALSPCARAATGLWPRRR